MVNVTGFPVINREHDINLTPLRTTPLFTDLWNLGVTSSRSKSLGTTRIYVYISLREPYSFMHIQLGSPPHLKDL